MWVDARGVCWQARDVVRPPQVRERLRRAQARLFYGAFVPRGGLCFDVGANVGDRTELFLSLGARVVAVEPQALCRERLRVRFGSRVTVVGDALGSFEGTAEMLVANYHTLSSLSPEWTDAVRESGRFAAFEWDRREPVRLTTLDALIEAHGIPDFCKIDVEGYELEVVRGLSRPLPTLSFEFTVERLDSRIAAVEHLAGLGMTRFNFSFGESLRLALPGWADLSEIRRFLTSDMHTPSSFGDVYAREA